MPFMTWNDEYLTETQRIDYQHRWLVNATNKLYDAVTSSDMEKQQIGELLLDLVEYAMNHFISEEDLFNRYNYPDTENHIEEHNEFNKSSVALLDKYDSDACLDVKSLEFLKNWLDKHISTSDIHYATFYKTLKTA